jgi:hypothetical protein
MPEEKPSSELTNSTADYVTSAAKAALGAVPFAGSLLAEIAGVDSFHGGLKVTEHAITPLGRLLLRQIELGETAAE